MRILLWLCVRIWQLKFHACFHMWKRFLKWILEHLILLKSFGWMLEASADQLVVAVAVLDCICYVGLILIGPVRSLIHQELLETPKRVIVLLVLWCGDCTIRLGTSSSFQPFWPYCFRIQSCLQAWNMPISLNLVSIREKCPLVKYYSSWKILLGLANIPGSISVCLL